MKFSIIMQSYLGHYRTAAADREMKIVRAINSALNQSFQDLEVVVVADGCEKTMEIVKGIDDSRIRCFLIPKSKIWSGEPRTKGIDEARGEFITYLDIDDLYGENHLKNINEQLKNYDWVYFDDIRYSVKNNNWYQNSCNIKMMGMNGTSNICHKRSLPYRWTHNGYAHDYYFIKLLRQNYNCAKIEGGEYYVCHLPHSSLGKGYDL
jgi:glycosyltransferase involved in cell wall biosynthesis